MLKGEGNSEAGDDEGEGYGASRAEGISSKAG